MRFIPFDAEQIKSNEDKLVAQGHYVVAVFRLSYSSLSFMLSISIENCNTSVKFYSYKHLESNLLFE